MIILGKGTRDSSTYHERSTGWPVFGGAAKQLHHRRLPPVLCLRHRGGGSGVYQCDVVLEVGQRREDGFVGGSLVCGNSEACAFI